MALAGEEGPGGSVRAALWLSVGQSGPVWPDHSFSPRDAGSLEFYVKFPNFYLLFFTKQNKNSLTHTHTHSNTERAKYNASAGLG